MEAERVLGQSELNRAVLARQSLLRRRKASLPKAVEAMAWVQAQYAPSMYVGLWSRLEGFERDSLTRSLGRRTVVQGTLLRATIHLVSAGDYWPAAVAIRRARREMWLKARHRERLEASELAAAARSLRKRFEGSEFERADLDEALKDRPGSASVWRNAVGMWLDLVRVPPSGTWERRRADRYALAEDWVGPEDCDEARGVELLVRRYLGGFGPATRAEIADWAGLPAKKVQAGLDRIELRRFRSEDGAELVDLPRAPLPDPETPAPVRFLPTWDATLLAHARRAQILREDDRPKVFNVKTPQSAATFLVDGQVAGTWRHEGKKGVQLQPFGRLEARVRRELGEEAGRLADFHA
jgi:hypothetical protein